MKRGLILVGLVLFVSILVLSFVSVAGNSFETAELITPGNTYTGENLKVGEKAYFKLSPMSGKKAVFSLNFEGGKEGVYVETFFYNKNREEIWDNRHSVGDSPSLSGEDSYIFSDNNYKEDYYCVIKNGGFSGYDVTYTINSYTLTYSTEDYSDADSGVDVGDDFEKAYKIDYGTYKGSLINGYYLETRVFGDWGIDRKDMYKINVGKNKKIGLKLTPETNKRLEIIMYDEARKKVAGKSAPNEGAIINLEYTSSESQTLYILVKIYHDTDNGGKYTLEISDLGKGEVTDTTKSTTSTKTTTPSFSNSGTFDNKRGAGFLVIFLAFLIPLLIIIFFILYVYFALIFMTLAKKTGTEPKWFAWVPILNLILLAKIAQVPSWTVVLVFVPLANIAILVWYWYKVALRRGYEGYMGILMLVPIVQFIIPAILAWKDPSSTVKR